MRVLVVDDDVFVLEVIKHALINAGLDPLTTTSGEDALRFLRNGDCHLVLCDWKMPHMSGPELCRIVRAEKLPGYVYIILLTANDGTQQRIDGLAAGADDFIAKPFVPGELIARVRAGERILTANRAELQAEITMRRHAENESDIYRQNLESTNVELEGSNRKLSALYETAQRFIDNVSHEFRTPLSVIKGYAEVLSQEMVGPVNERQKDLLRIVADRTRDLAQMVDDLLDSSKLRAGTLRINRSAHRVEDILSPIWPMLKSKAIGKKIELDQLLEPNLPEFFADAEKAGRVLVNMVVNAIKFSTETDHVTVWARLAQDEGIEIGVTDYGPGISPHNVEVIFERFKQLRFEQSDSDKGFGLGLNIARELVALNLGEIHLSSSLGRGSTFSFTLPPNDSQIVMRRYLAYLKLLPKVDPIIALLRIGCPSGKPADANLRNYIASAVRPTDLVLPASTYHSLMVIGCTCDVDRWVDHLRRSSEEFFARLKPDIDRPAIEVLGDWPYPSGTEELWPHILKHLRPELSYA